MNLFSTWKHRLLIAQRIFSKTFFKALGPINTRLQPEELFDVKPGYHHAGSAESFIAVNSDDEYQRSVYKLAGDLASAMNNPTILDVGCGSGSKLINMLGNYSTVGIEIEPTYSWLVKTYPKRKWLLYDPVATRGIQADIVICADVIEHISNPDELMIFLNTLQFKYLVISTPERDRIFGTNDYGPPQNTFHYREWNAEEFAKYISRWFVIHQQYVFDDKSITQAIVCSRNELL